MSKHNETKATQHKHDLADKRGLQQRRNRAVALLGCMVVLITALALMVPAISITKDVADETPGIEVQSTQDEITAKDAGESAAPEPAAEEPAAEEPAAEEPAAEEPAAEEPAAEEPAAEEPATGEAATQSVEAGDAGDLIVNDDADNDDEEIDANAAIEDATASSVGSIDPDSESDMPAQTFEADLKDADDNVVLSVFVDAPEGAFPAGTFMEIDGIAADKVQDKVEQAIKDEKGDNVQITKITAVDIIFKDADKNEIEPAKKVEVKITTNDIRDYENTALVHVLDKSKESSKGKSDDAEVITKVSVVNKDEDDKTKGTEDTMKFESKAFSPYVIVALKDQLIVTEEGNRVLTVSGDDYTITITIPAEVDVPENATLQVEEIMNSALDWVRFVNKVEDKLGKEVEYARLFDVRLMDGNEEVQPSAPIDVQIKLDDASVLTEETQVVSFSDDAVSTLDNELEEDAVKFQADAGSMYGVVGTQTITVPFTASDGSTYEVTVTYGPEAEIPEDAELVVTEVTEADAEYDEYVEQTAETVGVGSDDLTYIKLLDISIMVGNEKVQPKAPVDVQIRLMDKEESEDPTKVVHFGEEATEVVDADVSDETVEFEAAGFSIYAVTSYPSTTSDLDGKTFTIVHENDSPYGYEQFSTYYGRALQADPYNANYLKSEVVRVEQHTNGYNVTTDRPRTDAYTDPQDLIPIAQWKFTLVDGTTNEYYIQDTASGKYLNMGTAVTSANSQTIMSDVPQPMKVTRVSGTNKVQITCTVGSTTKYLRDNDTSANTAAGTNAKYFTFGANSANYTRLSLYETEFFDRDDLADEYRGVKISSQILKDGDKVLIYRNEYASFRDEYGDYVLDGNGNPVLAVDNGDSIVLRSEVNPVWTFRVVKDTSGNPSAYYIFENEQTGTFLIPNLAAGTLVVDSWAPAQYTNNMTLPGKQDGNYTTNFAYWDGSGAYIGYQIVENEGHTAMITKPGRNSATASVNESQQFSFAKVEELDPSTELHQVGTVDTNALGIKMRLFDYTSREQMNSVMGRTGLDYTQGDVTYGLVSKTIDPNTGFPTFTGNGASVSTMFGEGCTYDQGPSNYLFLDDVYESTGFLEYACFNNFAHYNAAEDKFEVYAERGSPRHDGSDLKFSWQRGNFFPYNSLDPNTKGWNLFDDSGQLLDYDNPNYADELYCFKEATNYWFGMSMDFSFLMPEDGLINGEPMIYEFNGDDDLWIYIDGVLTLDIGGIHSAIPGKINFATGEIWNGATNGQLQTTTIKACFQEAGVFPDGKPWDDARVDEYFNGNTFAGFGTHDFKMLYAEHGAGASNLKVRFNMPVVERGQFTVEKELKGDVQSQFANMQFAYQAFMQQTESSSCELITENSNIFYVNKINPDTGIVEDVSSQNIPVPLNDNVVIDGQTFNGVFYLKPGEKVAFKNRVEDLNYFVQEIGILDANHGGLITRVDVMGVATEGTPIHAGSDYKNYATDEKTVRNRGEVKFANYTVGENLRITKVLEAESVDIGDTFEVRVLLENEVGNLYQYAFGHYAVVDEDGIYYAYAGGRYEPVGTTPYFENQASQYGCIEGLEAGMTVIIQGLVPGTDFFVDEIRVAPYGNPDPNVKTLLKDSGWNASYKTENQGPAEIHNTTYYDYQTSSMQPLDSSMGTIKREADKDAHVTVTNEAKNRFEVHKVWGSDDTQHPENNFVTQHGNVQIALFEIVGQGSQQTLQYIQGSLRTIVPGQSSHSYDANIKANVMSDNVVVREVKVTGEGASQVVTPIDVNGAIAVSGEKTKVTGSTGTATNTYVVTYDQGTPTQGTTGQIREDTVINTLPQLIVNKNGADTDRLAGVTFKITDSNGNTIGWYGTNGEYVSTDAATGGNLISGINLSNGTYYLVETATVDSYLDLGYRVRLTVDEVQGGAKIIRAETDTTPPTPFADETSGNNLLYTFTVHNTPGVELPMTGGPGTVLYTLGGFALLVAAVCIYGFGSRCRRERRLRG